VNYEGYAPCFEAQKHPPHGPADLDEPSRVAVFRVADLRLLLSSRPPRTSAPRKRPSRCTIQLEPSADTIEVVNYSGGEARGFDRASEILNPLDGSLKWEKTATVDSAVTTPRIAHQDGIPVLPDCGSASSA